MVTKKERRFDKNNKSKYGFYTIVLNNKIVVISNNLSFLFVINADK